jgi:hypothetical protein
MSWRHAPIHELERHVMRCRRKEEPALLMLAHVPGRGPATGHRLAHCFRATDSVTLVRVGRRYELTALFDDDGFDRVVLERRLRSAAGTEPAVAWARFPDDGVTLGALLLAARTELSRLSGGAAAVAMPATLATASTPAAVDGK